ncbi:hypothetical protein ZIOFF_060293 [Zingiber officinale]|uniref:Uncharacterized protein n=1 Tax=Zingiber officinale TaxID=94328 RepID=A0A8J5F8D9_ZINOF|nr:hypothetical protein ZIOFF_060293 [Zingiber officinale]
MGCAQSRIENEEAVVRCNERRQWMKSAVSARNAFAAAHSAYAVELKNTGAALAEFGQGEPYDPNLPSSYSSSVGVEASAYVAPIQPPSDADLLPPPRPSEFSAASLQRSISMPDLPNKFPSKIKPEPTISEDDDEGEEEADEEEEDEEEERGTRLKRRHRATRADAPYEKINTPVPPPPTVDHLDGDAVTSEKVVIEPPLPPKVPKKLKQGRNVHHQQAQSASTLDAKRGKIVPATRPSVNLSKILMDLDDHFLKASESTHDVLKMLEATRMHYHSNFADSRGHMDHAARIMRVITWNRSFKGVSWTERNKDDDDDDDDDELETHATVLDKILAWEKKLYDEVKAGELMKIEYQRKADLLDRQKKHGARTETLERTKAAVSHLQTKLIVDLQSVDSTVSEIERIRDKQLYPKLVDLVDGMAKMWQAMLMHHSTQMKIVMDLKALDVSNVPKESSEQQYSRTLQLHQIVKAWHSNFRKLVTHQKEYVTALNSWLKLSIIPIETGLKDKESSPQKPPIQPFLHDWHDHLEKIPLELAANAIQGFSAVISTILTLQDEEIKQKEKARRFTGSI